MTAAEATARLGKRRRQQAEFCESTPVLSAPAVFGRDDLAACVEVILVPQQTLDAAAQEFLLFCKLNIHRMPRATR